MAFLLLVEAFVVGVTVVGGGGFSVFLFVFGKDSG